MGKESSEEIKKESNDDISSVSSNFSDLGIIKTLNAKAKKKRKSQFCTEPKNKEISESDLEEDDDVSEQIWGNVFWESKNIYYIFKEK